MGDDKIYTPLDRAVVWRDRMSEEFPDFDAALADACDGPALATLGEQCATRELTHVECRVAFGQAVNQILNDWIEMLMAVRSGMGRSAARASRSLFETSLILRELHSDQATALRYLDHGTVVFFQLTEFDIGEKHLKGGRLRSARHHRQKRRKQLKPLADALVAKYGAGFRRAWTPLSSFDRATSEGRLDEYSGYRFASSLMHGGAAGAAGTVLLYDIGEAEPHPVFRLGPDLFLCRHAIRFGTVSMRRTLTTILDLGYEKAGAFAECIGRLEASIPVIEDSLAIAEARISPSEPPLPHRVLIKVWPSGLHGVWIHNENLGLITPGKVHDPLSEMALVRSILMDRDKPPLPAVATIHLPASVKSGAQWRDDSEVLGETAPTEFSIDDLIGFRIDQL